MSCLSAAVTRAFAAITSLSPGPFAQMVDVMRARSAPPLPLNEHATATIRRMFAGSHDHSPHAEDTASLRAAQYAVQAIYMIARRPSVYGARIPEPVRRRLWYVLAGLLSEDYPLDVPVHPLSRSLMQDVIQNLPNPQPLPESLPQSSRDLAQAVIAARLSGTSRFRHSILAEIARSPWASADVLLAGGIYSDLYQSVQQHPWNAHRLVIGGYPANPSLLAAAAKVGEAAARILRARPDTSDPVLIQSLASATLQRGEHPQRILDVLNERPDLVHTPIFHQALGRNPWVALLALRTYPALRSSPDLLNGLTRNEAVVRDALCELPEVRTSDILITALTSHPWKAMDVLQRVPELRSHPTLRAAVCLHDPCIVRLLDAVPDIPNPHQFITRLARTSRTAAYALRTLGPHPHWWRVLPSATREQIARSHGVSSSVIAWLDEVATRTQRGEPEWTAEDVRFARQAPPWVQQMVRWMPAIVDSDTDSPISADSVSPNEEKRA